MTILALLLVVTGVFAQKIDQRLTDLVEQVAASRAQNKEVKTFNDDIAVIFNADGSLRALSAIATLKEGAQCPTAQLEQMGITVRFVLGDMVALVIPADKLQLLEQVDEFRYVNADRKNRFHCSEARKATKVDQVGTEAAAQALGLPKAFTGKDVVIGVIDGGIDFNHAAFRNADGTTRIKKAIVYNGNLDFQAYTTPEEISTLTADITFMSHGTHTAAIAGGSETGNGEQGVAPEADLVLCAVGRNPANSNIVQSMQTIFDYAQSVGKPAVVNISMGTDLGLHDGSDEVARGVATLTENGTKPGRAVCLSSSNSSSRRQSIVKKFATADEELLTVLGSNSDASLPSTVNYNTSYYMYADDYQEFTPTVRLVSTRTGEVLSMDNYKTEFYDQPISQLVTINKGTAETLKGTKATIYKMDLSLLFSGTDVRLALSVKPGHAGQTVKLMCDGDNNAEPCFDAPSRDGYYNFAANGYTQGNGDFAFSTMGCTDAAISVGSFITRTTWKNYEGDTPAYPASRLTGKTQVIGEISDFSSYGTDDNGKTYPTLVAPGQGLISACSNYDVRFFLEDSPGVPNKENNLITLCPAVERNGRMNFYELSQGTSMSTPFCAGTVALWLQAKPTLTVSEIKDIMKQTCVNDDYTTNTAMIPSGNKLQAGYGKLDGLAGLKAILGTSGIEAVSADGHREATPATMYSVDAPVYNMMGQQVGKSHKGLVIYKGRKYFNRN